MSAAELINLRYRFPEASSDALDDVSWRIESGSFNLLVGPSGSGKTTLLRALNGLVPHFHGGCFGGTARIFGLDTRAHGPRELAGLVGTVFQDPEAQCVTDNVEDELVFGMEQLGVPRAEMTRRVAELLDRLEIGRLRERSLSTLSGGERQRVILAAALALQPRLLALDEPTSQLDPNGADAFLDALTTLDDATVVIAEHRLERLLPLADQLAVMDGGRLRAGPTRKMLSDLRDPPPVVELAQRLGWRPLPLSVEETRSFLDQSVLVSGTGERDSPLREIERPFPRRGESRSPSGKRSQSDSNGDPILTAEGVSLQLDGGFALRNVSFSLREGEIVALIGRNGSGKTTLLKALIGLLRTERGRIVVDGHDAQGHSVAELARWIGYVPQHPTSILHQETLRAELALTLRVQRKRGDIPATLAALGIGQYADQHPLDLSGGERQRAALAALAVTEPRLLLLDEPTRGLPMAEKQRLAGYLRGYVTQGRAALVVTHDAEFVARHADRVLRLDDGMLVGDGPPARELSATDEYRTQIQRFLGGTVLTVDDFLMEEDSVGSDRPALTPQRAD